MNLQNLKNKLKPKLHEIEIEGEKLYIHRPTAKDFEKCNTAMNTLVYCVKDENNDPIFSTKDENGRLNVNELDTTFITEIYGKVLSLFEKSDVHNEIEKKILENPDLRYYLKMINKRGLSPDEFDNLDPDLFQYLMIFDSCVEPSGSHFEMMKFAYSQYNSFISNPNFNTKTRKEFKVSDFDFLGILDSQTNELTTKERNEKYLKDKKKKQSNDIAELGKMLKGMTNGKQQ